MAQVPLSVLVIISFICVAKAQSPSFDTLIRRRDFDFPPTSVQNFFQPRDVADANFGSPASNGFYDAPTYRDDNFNRYQSSPIQENNYNRQPVNHQSAYYGGHFGLPTGSASHTGPDDFDSDRSLTPEEIESKKANPVPFLINPLIRRGTQGLQRIEANFIRNPKKHQLSKPILALFTNPSKKRK